VGVTARAAAIGTSVGWYRTRAFGKLHGGDGNFIGIGFGPSWQGQSKALFVMQTVRVPTSVKVSFTFVLSRTFQNNTSSSF